MTLLALESKEHEPSTNEGIVGKGGDANVGEWGGGLGAGCPGRWRGAGSWAGGHSRSTGGQRGGNQESSLAGEISDCSLIIRFMHKVHLCYLHAW